MNMIINLQAHSDESLIFNTKHDKQVHLPSITAANSLQHANFNFATLCPKHELNSYYGSFLILILGNYFCTTSKKTKAFIS